MDIALLLRLILAHIITDFIFQPSHWVKDKKEKKEDSKYLYFHVLLTGIIAYLAIMDWRLWYVATGIMVSHYLIDLGKLHLKESFKYFILDQILHILVLVLAWMYISGTGIKQEILLQYVQDPNFLVLATAFALVIWPTGYAIAAATEKWRNEVKEDDLEKESLANAGMYIGIFERVLVLIFILNGKYEAIGFLIAAKSILRISQSKKTEYVLVGTLISFTVTIIIGLLTMYVMKTV
jgi:hypothetical protein